MCDSNNGVLSKLVLSDTARSLDVICAGNDEKKSLGEMKGMKNNNNKVFFERKVWSQNGGKFSLGCPTLLTVFDSRPSFFCVFVQKEKKSKESIIIRLLKEI